MRAEPSLRKPNYIVAQRIPGKPTLRKFLIRDTGPMERFRADYPVGPSGNFALNLCLDIGRTKQICGLTGLKRVFVDVVQEKRDGQEIKVLYGWGNKEAWGKPSQVRIKYILAKKQAGAWNILREAIPLMGLNEKQKARRFTHELAKALYHGLGTKKLIANRKVISHGTKDAYIGYQIDDREIHIYGFKGRQQVTVVVIEENEGTTSGRGRIVLYCYNSRKEYLRGLDPIKMVIVSERDQGGQLTPLFYPRVIFSSEEWRAQSGYVKSREMHEFLTADTQEGAFFNFGPRKVVGRGSVRIGLDHKYLTINGYMGHDYVVGRIITQGNEKRMYFWASEKSRDSGDPPLKSKGHLVAQKNGNWVIVWKLHNTSELKALINRALRYGNYLFSDVNGKVYFENWRITGVRRRTIRKQIRGREINTKAISASLLDPNWFSATRQVNSRFKFVEFWQSAKDFNRGQKPVLARFITFKPHDSQWEIFWADFTEAQKFRELLKQGAILAGELEEALTLENGYLWRNYHRETYALLNAVLHL